MLHPGNKVGVPAAAVTQMAINLNFDNIGNQRRENRVAPYQGDFRPGDGGDEVKAIGCQDGRCQLGDRG